MMEQFFISLLYFFPQARNSILARIASTFQGLPTIHATRSERVLMDEFHRNVDLNTSASYLNYAARRAFAFWLDVVGTIYISAIMYVFLTFLKDGESFDKNVKYTVLNFDYILQSRNQLMSVWSLHKFYI